MCGFPTILTYRTGKTLPGAAGGYPFNVTYDQEVNLSIAVPSGALSTLKERVQNLTRGRFGWEV